MLTALEPPLGNARERIDDSDANIFLTNITIVISKYFKDMISIFAKTVKELKDTVLVIILRISRLKDSTEEVVYKDADCLLEMLSEMQKQTVENGHCAREDFVLAGYSKLQESTTERVTNYSDEFSSVDESGTRILEARMNKIKPKKNFTDVIDIIEFPIQVFALQELAQLVENQQGITGMWLLQELS